jgi:hypothetical protein
MLGYTLFRARCSTGILEKRPVHEKIWMCDNQADETMKEHDYKSTILLYKRFLEKMPTNGLALYPLGYAYGQTGNHMKEVFYKNPSLNAPPFRAEFFI